MIEERTEHAANRAPDAPSGDPAHHDTADREERQTAARRRGDRRLHGGEPQQCVRHGAHGEATGASALQPRRVSAVLRPEVPPAIARAHPARVEDDAVASSLLVDALDAGALLAEARIVRRLGRSRRQVREEDALRSPAEAGRDDDDATRLDVRYRTIIAWAWRA